MSEIKVSKKVMSKLKKLNVKSLNIESDLYILANKYLIKNFIEDDKEYLEEKEKKVEALMKKKINGTIPTFSKIIIDNQFSGYVMPYIKNTVELKEIISKNISKENLFNIMISLSENLEEMHKQGIIYGDISDSNIIIDEKERSQISFRMIAISIILNLFEIFLI